MPRKRLIEKKRRLSIEVNRATRRVMFVGSWFFEDPFADDSERETFWRTFRKTLLAEWIAEHPGTRPWAWWKFDAPEPRRRIIEGTAVWDDPDAPEWVRDSPLSFGMCPYANHPDTPVEYESEAAYLARHNLLSKAERAATGDGGNPGR